MSDPKAPREFIAMKRTEKSQWQYDEYSVDNWESFEAIAPYSGNFLQIRLIESSAYLELKEAFMHLLKLAVTIGEAENLTYNFKDYPSKRPAIELAVRMGWIKKK